MSGGFFYFRKKKIIPKTNPQGLVFTLMMVFYWRLPYDSLYHLRRVYSASYAYILDYHRSNVDLVCHSIFCSYNFLKNNL